MGPSLKELHWKKPFEMKLLLVLLLALLLSALNASSSPVEIIKAQLTIHRYLLQFFEPSLLRQLILNIGIRPRVWRRGDSGPECNN